MGTGIATVPIVITTAIPLSLRLSLKVQRPMREHPMNEDLVGYLTRLQPRGCRGKRSLLPFREGWELALRAPDPVALISLWLLGGTKAKGPLERSSIHQVPG